MTFHSPVELCDVPLPPLPSASFVEPVMETDLPSGKDIAAALISRKAARPKPSPPKEEASPSCVAGLTMTRHATPLRTTLVLTGVVDASTIHLVRDQAFTEIGTHPKLLCLDLSGAGQPDSSATDTLVTIGNVARMMGIAFCVRVSPAFASILKETGLLRLMPFDTETTETVRL